MITLQIIDRLTDCERLAADWNELADAAGASPLLRHEWLLACARATGLDRELSIFTARRNGSLLAAAPLVVDRSGVVPRLRSIGWQFREPEGFLHQDEAALAEVCRGVLASGRAVVLPRLDAASAEWRLLGDRARRLGLPVLRPSTTSYYFTPFPESWEAFEAAMDSRKRSRLRRMRRGLEEHGTVTFEVLSPTEAEADAAVAEVQRVEARSWKARSGSAMLAKGEVGRYVAEYARLAAREGMLRVSLLRLNGEAIAGQIDVEHGRRLWGLKMGADERWLKYGPGILANHELFRWCIEQGLEGCEHLGDAEEWQRRWPFEVRERSTFRFYPPRLGAAVAFGFDAAAYAQRGVKARAVARARAAEKAARAA